VADSPADAFRALVEEAEALAARRAWQQVGDTWVRAARVAIDASALPSARQAFEAAGEAYRRDDRPRDARRALASALSLPCPTPERAVTLARLAGVLAELGLGSEALARASEGLQVAAGPARNIVLDTAIGVSQGFARKQDVRPLVEQLELAEGPHGIARWFRRGQLYRLDGELSEAARCFRTVRQRLAGQDGAEAGVAAAEMELAEVRLLEGDPGPAIEAFERGRVLHEVSGRRAYRYRCEAGRVRGAVEGRATVFSTLLDEGLAFARRRHMVLLAVDLLLARGLAVAERDAAAADRDLREAESEAVRVGARLRAGRAALEWGCRVAHVHEQRREALQRAVEALEDHVPLRDRAVAALSDAG
jgi:hypothetical protein